MLDIVRAVRFDRRTIAGRSRPCLIAAEAADGHEVELVAKFSRGCDRGVNALVAEAIAAVLAADLSLPVPESFLVHVSKDFARAIPDSEQAQLVLGSISPAFGSKKLPTGFSTWPVGRAMPTSMIQQAAEIFAFDAMIGNDDRRPENPNCHVKGEALAIFDHELAFSGSLVLGWQPPWKLGALQRYREQGRHIFTDSLRGRNLSFAAFQQRWNQITDARLEEYKRALPPEWSTDPTMIRSSLNLIANLRDNIVPTLTEVTRAIG